MAKKDKKEQDKVMCQECCFGGNIENYMIECFNKNANLGAYKKGLWAKVCNYYVERKITR